MNNSRPKRQAMKPKRYIDDINESAVPAKKLKILDVRPGASSPDIRENDANEAAANEEAKNKEWKCDCGLIYQSRDALNKHKRTKHRDTVKKYVCRICKTKYVMADTLVGHYRTQHGRYITTAFANKQMKEFPNDQIITSHDRRIVNEYVYIITCKCNQILKGTYNFKRHVRNQHDSIEFDVYMASKVKQEPSQLQEVHKSESDYNQASSQVSELNTTIEQILDDFPADVADNLVGTVDNQEVVRSETLFTMIMSNDVGNNLERQGANFLAISNLKPIGSENKIVLSNEFELFTQDMKSVVNMLRELRNAKQKSTVFDDNYDSALW